MKLIILAALAASLTFAADELKGPQPIPKERYEDISKRMILAQSAQLNTRGLKEAAEKQIRAAQDEEAKAVQSYLDMVESLRKEYHAEGCTLTIDKSWDCPKKEGEKK